MRWETLDLIKLEDTGDVDELENPIKDPTVFKTIKARVTPWTAEELKLEDRTITQNSRKLITPEKMEAIKDVEKVEIDGNQYNVIGKRRYGRMRALIVEGYYG